MTGPPALGPVAKHRDCIVAEWRRALRGYPGGAMLVRAILPKSNAGIALRVSLAGTVTMWITFLAV